MPALITKYVFVSRRWGVHESRLARGEPVENGSNDAFKYYLREGKRVTMEQVYC